MIQHPAILSLVISSLTISAMVLYAAWLGFRIQLKWDIGSGSELQLVLERRTYLVSTILSYALAFQILSLFLFIYTADDLHALFTGAMCAAGTLNVNGYGYPVLILKVVNCILAGVWLIVNHADTRGYDYPLIKVKYTLLDILAPLILAETVLLVRYFSGLHADIITSCCGSLFSTERPSLAGDIVSLPQRSMEYVFYAGIALTVVIGLVFFIKGRLGYFFSALSAATLIVGIVSMISFICLYYYELPTHHCPFCILQSEYGYIGYVLYGTLLGGAVTGIGAGALMPFRRKGSLAGVVPGMQKRLALYTIILYLAFTLLVTYRMVFSTLRLDG